MAEDAFKTLKDALNDALSGVDENAYVMNLGGGRIAIFTTDEFGQEQSSVGLSADFKNFIRKTGSHRWYVNDKAGLGKYLESIIRAVHSDVETFPSPYSFKKTPDPNPGASTKGKEPYSEERSEASSSRSKITKGTVHFGEDKSLILIDPQGREVGPNEMPSLTEKDVSDLLQMGYHAMTMNEVGVRHREEEARGRKAQEELGRQAMIAQILQATRTGELKSSEAFEISNDLTEGDLDPEKLKKIGTKILKARKKALEEFVGKKRQAKSLGPRALKKLLVGMYGK